MTKQNPEEFRNAATEFLKCAAEYADVHPSERASAFAKYAAAYAAAYAIYNAAKTDKKRREEGEQAMARLTEQIAQVAKRDARLAKENAS